MTVGSRSEPFELRTHASISEIAESAWNELCPDAPFLSHRFLDALERTGCARADRGWLPAHLGLYRGETLIAAAPAYVKGNSDGEFVFDHSWARFAYENLGIEYYPKLILAVPFTPANGARILLRKDAPRAEVFAAFAAGLRELSARMDVSGAHVLFLPQADAERFVEHGFAERYGVQFHWRNRGYANFDEFLARFSSKRRNQIRRERRELRDAKLELVNLTGSDLTASVADFLYEIYQSTVNKYFYGRLYLNRAFFEEVCTTMSESLHVVAARDTTNGRLIAAAFNLLGERALYGRYWGAIEERPFVHFNVCFYGGIEACIERKLALFEPGAGGEHKLSRGFEPSITHSVHYMRDPRLDHVVRDFLERERKAILRHINDEQADASFRVVD